MHGFLQMMGEIAQILIHDVGVHPREKAGMRIAGGWTHRTEQVDPLVFGLSESAGTAAAFSPYSSQSALLAEPGLVLKPEDDIFSRFVVFNLFDRLRECFF